MSLFELTAYGIVVALLCRILPRKFRWVLLLAASYGFYCVRAFSGLPFLLLTTGSTYAAGRWIGALQERSRNALKGISGPEKKIQKKKDARKVRAVLAGALIINFGVLFVFKYLDALLGLTGGSPLELVMPLGLSFYLFQASGYLFDVAGGKRKPESNFLKFALFVSYFPQLIQGPIGRYDHLAPQLQEPESVSFEDMIKAFFLIFWGLTKKLVLADRAMLFVNGVFDVPAGTYGAEASVAAVLLYSLQQYCDFSGGIDLVMGLSELMGVRLMANFKRPYFSVSLADFWRRWHITLGSWMRDYVFYPFVLSKPMAGLSKKVKGISASLSRTLPAAIGNLLVFLLVGLWHGATSNYILWGLYNGIILAVSALLEPFYKRFEKEKESGPVHVLRVLRTFLVVNIGWFFDRALSGTAAFQMLGGVVLDWRRGELAGMIWRFFDVQDIVLLLVFTALLFTVSLLMERGIKVRDRLAALPLPARWGIMMGLILSVVIFGIWGSGYSEAAFLYYKF